MSKSGYLGGYADHLIGVRFHLTSGQISAGLGRTIVQEIWTIVRSPVCLGHPALSVVLLTSTEYICIVMVSDRR